MSDGDRQRNGERGGGGEESGGVWRLEFKLSGRDYLWKE